jgi:hypothetical protein
MALPLRAICSLMMGVESQRLQTLGFRKVVHLLLDALMSSEKFCVFSSSGATIFAAKIRGLWIRRSYTRQIFEISERTTYTIAKVTNDRLGRGTNDDAICEIGKTHFTSSRSGCGKNHLNFTYLASGFAPCCRCCGFVPSSPFKVTPSLSAVFLSSTPVAGRLFSF